MSFSLQIQQILQYSYNIFFSSALPIIYLFVGGAFAAFVLGKSFKCISLINIWRFYNGSRNIIFSPDS